jgi:hypothetical protein
LAVTATGLPARRVTADCAAFAAVVETILQRRRSIPAARRVARGGLAVPRAWTRDELCLEAYSSYRALLRGAVRRPPRREVVLAIADYLQCSHSERNQLLTAAGYAAEHPGPSVAELRAALDTLGTFIETLPLPAYAVSRDWTVQLINDHLLRLLGLARADLIGLPTPKRNVLRLLFDPALPVRRLLEPDAASWSRLAAFTVMRFREDNEPWQYDHWYRGLVTRLTDLPDFLALLAVGPVRPADADRPPGRLGHRHRRATRRPHRPGHADERLPARHRLPGPGHLPARGRRRGPGLPPHRPAQPGQPVGRRHRARRRGLAGGERGSAARRGPDRPRGLGRAKAPVSVRKTVVFE